MDSDDEVRDRALLYLEILKQKQKSLTSHYILSGESHMTTSTSHVTIVHPSPLLRSGRSERVCGGSGAFSAAVLQPATGDAL